MRIIDDSDPGYDVRNDVDFGEAFLLATPRSCSASRCGTVTDANIVVKEHHATQPLGHLFIRCPEHWGARV